MRLTHALVDVAYALASNPAAEHWGYELFLQTGVRSGVLYPILSRMLDEGWLTDGWESEESAARDNRPPRRYYTLTETGIAELGGVLRKADRDRRFIATPRAAW